MHIIEKVGVNARRVQLHCQASNYFSMIPPTMHKTFKAEQPVPFVEETKFGIWFLRTQTWFTRVLTIAINDLQRMMPPTRAYPEILDIGCGRGRSITLLEQRFRPLRVVGIDPDANQLREAARNTAGCKCRVELLLADAAVTGLPDASFDMVFCHQAFHHIVDQENAMREFYRVLKPGGVLLFAESTKRYIHSWMIRWLFRHPMEAQKTAGEYIALIRASGFTLPPEKISFPYLWWSREDLGLLEKLGVAPPLEREETLVNAVAVKPAN